MQWRHNSSKSTHNMGTGFAFPPFLRSDVVEWYLKWKVWVQRLQIWFCFIPLTSSRDVIIGKLLQNTYLSGSLLVHWITEHFFQVWWHIVVTWEYIFEIGGCYGGLNLLWRQSNGLKCRKIALFWLKPHLKNLVSTILF